MNSILQFFGLAAVAMTFGAIACGVQGAVWRQLRQKKCPVLGVLSALFGAFFIGLVGYMIYGQDGWYLGAVSIVFYWWTELAFKFGGSIMPELRFESAEGKPLPRNFDVTMGMVCGLCSGFVGALIAVSTPFPTSLLVASAFGMFFPAMVVGLFAFCVAVTIAVVAAIAIPVMAIAGVVTFCLRPLGGVSAVFAQIREALDTAGNRVGNALPCGK